MEIIIRDKNKRYKQFRHRSGVEEAMRREWGTQALTDHEIDKLKFMENKLGMNHSSIKAHVIEQTLGKSEGG